MRALLALLIVAVLLVVGAVASGFVNVRQIRGAAPPTITATPKSVSAKGGRAPAFEVETGSVKVGSKPATVRVPIVQVQKPSGNQAAAATNNAM